jgi:hypothetical protein
LVAQQDGAAVGVDEQQVVLIFRHLQLADAGRAVGGDIEAGAEVELVADAGHRCGAARGMRKATA